jgi:transposase, IS5 family
VLFLYMEKQHNETLTDVLSFNRRRKLKDEFFNQINTLIDWKPIEKIIYKYYKKKESASGRPAYNGLMLFKINLLQTWYSMSDYEAEDRINDSLSFSKFIGLPVDMVCPDHSTISRFRSLMSNHKVYDQLLKEVNSQLESHKIIVKTGVIIDASIVETPLKPKTKAGYEIVEDRSETQRNPEAIEKEKNEKSYQKVYQPGVDSEGAWLKKGQKYYYGYKKHVVTDSQGLVLTVSTTSANVNEIAYLEEVLSTVDLPTGTAFYGDKGYKSENNDEILKKKGLKNRIMYKGKKNAKLNYWQTKFNNVCSRIRYKVERTFGSIKRWFSGGRARYKGQEKVHNQNVIESLAYNLYRSPGIVMLKSLKS